MLKDAILTECTGRKYKAGDVEQRTMCNGLLGLVTEFSSFLYLILQRKLFFPPFPVANGRVCLEGTFQGTARGGAR